MKQLRIYVASPYTGDPENNTYKSMEYGNEILKIGHVPFLPLAMTHWWDEFSPKPYDTWMGMDRVWVATCDALFRAPGESKGADMEHKLAAELGKIIFHDIYEIPKVTE